MAKKYSVKFFVLCAFLLNLTGCGQSGDLYLPTPSHAPANTTISHHDF